MVRQWQEAFYDNRESAIDLHVQPDFLKLAAAYGVPALRASTADEAEKVLKEGFAHPGPILMEFQVSRNENCYPMVPAGSPSSKMLFGNG